MQNNYLLAELRIKKSLTQQNIANIMGIGYSTYKDYEAGLLPISLECLNKFSNFYNVSLDYLLGLSKKSKPEILSQDIDYSYLQFSIVYLRKKARLSQKKIAKEFGISIYSISKYEHNSRLITIAYLTKFAKKFKYSVDYLCGKTLKKEVL